MPTVAPNPADVRQAHPPRLLPAVLLAAILGISVSGPLARLSTAAPLAIAAWRLTLSMGVIALVLVATGSWREYRTLARRDLLIGVSAGSALFLHERATARQVVGIAIAMLGAVVIGYGDAGGSTATPNALAGDLLALVGAATVGVYYLVGRSLRQRLTLFPYVGLVYGASLVFVLLLAITMGVPLWPQPSREMWIFAGIALGPMMLGHTGFNWSLRYVPAHVVSLAILVEPVGATLLAAFLPGISEAPSTSTLLGGAVILCGLVVGTLGGNKTSAAADATALRPDAAQNSRTNSA